MFPRGGFNIEILYRLRLHELPGLVKTERAGINVKVLVDEENLGARVMQVSSKTKNMVTLNHYDDYEVPRKSAKDN